MNAIKIFTMIIAPLCGALLAAGNTARVTLADGSVIIGKIHAPTLQVETLLGTLEIPSDKITTVVFADMRQHAQQPRENRPVLAMDFDSTPPEITGRHAFIPGREGAGKALRVTGLDVTLPAIPSELVAGEGTLEFWARIPEADNNPLASRHDFYPSLLALDGPPFAAQLYFRLDDRIKNAGLCGVVLLKGHFWIGFGSASAHNPDIASLFANNDPAGWHHYAVTWSENGLDDPGHADAISAVGRPTVRKPLRGNPACALFVDGRRVAVGVTISETRPPNPAAPLVLTLQKKYAEDQRAWVIDYDDIKIWNTVKTEFDGVAPPPARLRGPLPEKPAATPNVDARKGW